MNIHFICRGNVLRSLIAETYLKSLNLTNVRVASSGTNVDQDDPTERGYFAHTIAVLKHHGIDKYAKQTSDQLTQERIAGDDVVVCMNQRVVDEAQQLIVLPAETLNWNIVDIGEAHRTVVDNRELYQEEIYQEITMQVDELVRAYQLV